MVKYQKVIITFVLSTTDTLSLCYNFNSDSLHFSVLQPGVVVINSGVCSPTVSSAVSCDKLDLNGAYTTSNNQAFVVTHNNTANDSEWKTKR